MSFKAVNLGGTASHVQIGSVAYGLMMMTWTSQPTPDEQAFEAFKTAIEQVPAPYKLFINSGEFYGHQPPTANLDLVARFFTKYPELADRCFLSVKGGTGPNDLHINASPENLRRSVDTVLKHLDGKKRLDLFECARVDPNVPIEEQIATLKGFIDEGKFDHIGLSEASAETLKRAHKVHPIAAIEIEVSPWAYEEEAKKVIATAAELGVTVAAYSPLGRGFLTGDLKVEDLPVGDVRRHLSRLQADAAEKNKRFVEKLTAIAQRKGITNAQLSLAWIISRGPSVVPLPGSSKAHRVIENMAAAKIEFTKEELKDIDEIIDQARQDVQGSRGFTADGKNEHLWG